MDYYPRLDDALEARPVRTRSKWPTGPNLRRRNLVRPRAHHRRVVQSSGYGNDDAASANSGPDSGPDSGPNSGRDSGLDSGPDSDDEETPVRRSVTSPGARFRYHRRRLVQRGGFDNNDGASSDSGLGSGPDSDGEDTPARQSLASPSARPRPHRRRLIQRGGPDSEGAVNSDSGLDSGPDSDDELTSVRQSLTSSSARPSATSRVSSGFVASSRTTISVTQSTPVRSAPATITTLAQALPTGLGAVLGAAEGDDVDSGIDSGIESLVDSDDETTSSAPSSTSPPSSTSATNTGQTTTSKSLTSTPATATLSSTSPPPAAIGVSVSGTPTSKATAGIAAPSSSSSSTSSSAKQTLAPAKSVTSTPSVTPTTLPTLGVPESQLASTQTPKANGIGAVATPGQAPGPVSTVEHKDLTQGQVAGAVIGALAGVAILVAGIFFIAKRLRQRGYRAPSLRLAFSRNDANEKTASTGTTWPSPWNLHLWGAAGSNGPRSTMSGSGKKNAKTNSEMLDQLIQATYATEGGGGGGNAGYFTNDEKTRRRQTDLESQSPPSPGSFLDENFIDQKSYAKLEGPWPLRGSVPAKASVKAAAPKAPGPVARWLDGLLTPRQSAAPPVPPPKIVPAVGQMATRWQPEPPLDGAGGTSGVGGVLRPPAPAFAKGSRARDTGMTETTTTGDSVVW